MRVAIIGRPNVGKSSLFNAFTKTRDALVHDRPGVTRDVVEGARDGVVFLDTAGLENSASGISKDATDFAIGAAGGADAVLFVVDGRAGLHPMDMEWAEKIRRMSLRAPPPRGVPVILLANKCESKKGLDNLPEFYKLGFGEPFPVSAEHNVGLDAVVRRLAADAGAEKGAATETRGLSIAIMGRPNVGKSTLVNRLLGTKRVLVADTPGITRDAVRIPARFGGRDIEIVDTAGLRKKSRVDDDIETLAALKALDVLAKTDAVILVMDATSPIDKQSVQIAEKICDAGRVLCVALNKWDLVSDGGRADRLSELKRGFRDGFSQIIDPLVAPISAETGFGVKNMMRRIYELWDISDARAPTSLINRAVEKLVAAKPPPMSRLKRPMKIKFASQTGLHPNVITINVGGASDIPESYARYLRRGLAEKLGWGGIPIVVRFESAKNPFD